tara:strand:+ start:139 stop:1608 length:1470 start_codon:yes stop_codon:yes gene_type:complete
MRDVNNYFSNSVEFLKDLGPSLLAASKKSKIPEYLQKNMKTAVDNAGKFTGDVAQKVRDGTYTTFFGNQSYKSGTPFSSASGTVADVIGNTVTSDKFRQQYVWPYTNAFRVVSKAGAAAANLTGLEDPMAKAAVVAGIPLFIHTMTETSGPITQGLRPKGYKAVAPVSKEEDPTGAKPRNIIEEGALRFIGGQKSQPLAYRDFIKERPDVMPSTISDYRRYMNRKPEAGKRIDIDPEKQTFTAYGGFVKGTARGLNDPEVRVRGVPVTASSVLGTAAGVATIAAGKQLLDPKIGVTGREPVQASLTKDVLRDTDTGKELKTDLDTYISKMQKENKNYSPNVEVLGQRKDVVNRPETYKFNIGFAKDGTGSKGTLKQKKYGEGPFIREDVPVGNIPSMIKEMRGNNPQDPDIQTLKDNVADFKKETFSKAAQQFQKLGDYKEPALVAGGLVAAIGTAAIAKKLFQKAEQERIKKEDPLQYKKYKRGDYTE